MSGDTAFAQTDRLSAVDISEETPPPLELEQERKVAIFDLIEESRLRIQGAEGPYRLTVARLLAPEPGYQLVLKPENAPDARRIDVRDASFEAAVRDYIALCAAYREAVRRLPPSQIEAADAERRALHSEASEMLRAALGGEAETDAATARRLFTLCCAVGQGMEKLL